MKAKKILPVVLSVFMAGGVFSGMLAGCTDKNNPNPDGGHVHSYGWVDNGDGTHSQKCNASGECDALVKGSPEQHVDQDSNNKCDECGADMTPASSGDTSVALPSDKKIYVVGDSTVCSFNDNYYLPRYGYGTQLAEYLNVTSDQIVNLALSGRSSKSFLTESNYTTLTNSIGEGDYLIIGFGHNDEKSAEPARFTDPNGSYTEPTTAKGTSFQYCLYENYVKMATDKGATPILCTPIVRYAPDGVYDGSEIHDTADGNYSEAIRTIGAATNTTVIDLTTLTKNVYEQDNEAAAYFHAYTTYEGDPVETVTGSETPEGLDKTHINKYGAKMVAYQFATALKETDNSLKECVRTNVTAPTKEADYPDAIKMDFVKPDYTPFDPTAYEDHELGGEWFRTVMGDVGGADKVANFSVTSASDKFTVASNTIHGKFASGSDGFAAAFRQVDVSKNFKVSATVAITKVVTGTTNQTAFGLMLRDDILVDTYQSSLASNYVAAGVLNLKGAIFSREGGSLSSAASANTSAVAEGDTYELSIERVGQTVTVKVGTATKVYTDFDFVARDNDYMYICLFATRGVTAEFSNVQFEITGDSQGA